MDLLKAYNEFKKSLENEKHPDTLLEYYESEITTLINSARNELESIQDGDVVYAELLELTPEAALRYNWEKIDTLIEKDRKLKSARNKIAQYDFIPHAIVEEADLKTARALEELAKRIEEDTCNTSNIYSLCVKRLVYESLNKMDDDKKDIERLTRKAIDSALLLLQPLRNPEILQDGKEPLPTVPSYIADLLVEDCSEELAQELEQMSKEAAVEIPITKRFLEKHHVGRIFKSHQPTFKESDIKQKGSITPVGILYYTFAHSMRYQPQETNYFKERQYIPEDKINEVRKDAVESLRKGHFAKAVAKYRILKGSMWRTKPELSDMKADEERFLYTELAQFVAGFLNSNEFFQTNLPYAKDFLEEIRTLFPECMEQVKTVNVMLDKCKAAPAKGALHKALIEYRNHLKSKKLNVSELELPLGEILAAELGKLNRADDIKHHISVCELVLRPNEWEIEIAAQADKKFGEYLRFEGSKNKKLDKFNKNNSRILDQYRKLNKVIVDGSEVQ